MVKNMTGQNKHLNSSTDKVDSPKAQYITTSVPNKKKSPRLEGGHSTKIGGMWTLTHEIILPKLYKLIINTELKGNTSLDLKNFYNHIKMCVNAMNRLQENFLSGCQFIKRHSYLEEYFAPDRYHP